MASKSRQDALIKLADRVLRDSLVDAEGKVANTYNGLIASFSVTVAMSGLVPAMAIYKNSKSKERNKVFELLAKMYGKDKEIEIDSQDLWQRVINNEITQANTQQFIDYAIALKLTVRTFNLV